jgi:glycosyltransferase involved in cell wall biosynthesis
MKVLCLAYHFPPVGGAAVQRNLRLIRFLVDAGHEPVVVTGRGARATRWTPQDETLESDVPSGMQVFRLDGEEAVVANRRWREWGERWLRLTKPWERWWTESVRRLAPQIEAEDVDLIYAPLVPFESFAGAQLLSTALDKPLVVDLHDPWALDEMIVYPTFLHRRAARRTMRSALRHADGIVINTPEAFERVRHAFPELASKPLAVVSNGFDSRDFEADVEQRSDEAFRIVHTGYLHTDGGRQHRRRSWFRRALGGTMYGVDILTRSHVFLLEAVDRLVAADPSLEPIEIHLAGVTTPEDFHAARGSTRVVFYGYIPHDESVELVRTADLLFLPMHKIDDGHRAGIVPGKTFEYLASGRPILAAVPPGDARDLLEQAGNAAVCGPDDVGGMTDVIREQVRRKRSGELSPAPDPALVKSYEWRALALELAALFEEVIGERRADAEATPSSGALGVGESA